MQQLVELQENYEAIRDADAEVIVVFRDDQEGVAGLEMSRESTGAEFPLLSDLSSKSSSAYSRGTNQTYVIDHDGVIRAILDGTTWDRPTVDEILSVLEQLANE